MVLPATFRTDSRVLAGQFESDIETQRPERGVVADTQARGAAKATGIDLSGPRKHISRVGEPDDAEGRAEQRSASAGDPPELRVQHDQTVSAEREAIGIEN